ncbi:MAG: endonuclease/exonuclease/phosphatase family protein [Nanoarchaeota archaeon]|nr:endonuclease/exonuclease/phosphatase family protein [Nanoarchaeota archaeon]
MNDDSFSVLNANIGSMYLWSIKHKLPPLLGNMYASLFSYGKTPLQGLESTSHLVRQYRPTIVCLQEVYDAEHPSQAQGAQLEKLVGPLYQWFVSGAGMENRAILVQKNVVNGHGSENIITSEGVPFGIAYKLNQPMVWVASVHLRYSNLEERKQQLEELLRWVDSKKEPVLLTGDFNTHAAWASIEKKEVAYHTFNVLRDAGFQNLSESVACTWRWGKYLPTAGRIKLDHFFGRGVKAVEEPVAVREHLRGWMDHLALYGAKFVVE